MSFGLKNFVLPSNKNDILPKNTLDRGLFLLMTVGIPAINIWEILILCKYQQDSFLLFCSHLVFQGFLFINIVGNMFYIRHVDNSAKNKDLPCILSPNWKYCHFCQINAPPRSYHCPICDTCILRRDQHCMFAGCCIGFYNHRYYILAVVYTIIGSLYCFIVQWPHCLETIGGYQLLSLACMVAPHIAVLLGFLSIYGFVCVVLQIILLLSFFLTSYLLIVQSVCIFHGQTIHEKRSGVMLYDLGWKKNFCQVLGSRWYIAIVWPFVKSHIEGDGISFTTYHDLVEVKNV